MDNTFDLIVRGGTVLTMDGERRVIEDAVLAVRDDSVVALSSSSDFHARFPSPTAKRTIDASGRYVFPGFITTHTHLFQTFLKGLGRDRPLFEWLDASVRRALKNYDPECMHYSALVGLTEALRTGTTTVTDYQYCHPGKGFDEAVISAYQKLGVRCVMSKAHADVSSLPPECALAYVESEDDYFSELEDLCAKYQGDPMVKLSLAPGIIWDHSKEGFIRTREVADRWGIPITMHLVETEADDEFALSRYGMRAVDFLDDVGLLGNDFVGVHCVHLSASDIQKFKDRGVKVSHCPVSNMILASGVAPVPQLLKAGVTVSLACDGAASNDSQDMLEVMKTAALLHKVATRDAAAVSASSVLEMATLGGAAALGMEKSIGSLEVGKKADFFVYDPLNARSTPVHDPVAMIVYSGSPAGVRTVVVGGKVVLQDGAIVGLDEAEALRRAQSLAASLVARSGL